MTAITSIHIERGAAELQDRAEIFNFGDRFVIAVADGVGGIAGGALAAETFIYNVKQAAHGLISTEHCRRLLHQVDSVLAGDLNGAETTGVVAVVDSGSVFGAACGDSGARIYRSGQVVQVTPTDRPRSFLGNGTALVSDFTADMTGTLIVATDGLWKYAKSPDIAAVVNAEAPESLARALANLPRLKSGNLPDDIAVVTCRTLHD